MQIITPQKISILHASVLENDAPLWNASTSYAKDDRVIYEHYVYESIVNNNTGNIPLYNRDSVNAAWMTIGVTNLYACLDDYIHTKTMSPDATPLMLQVSLRPPATAIALLGLRASRATVSVHNRAGELVYGGTPIRLLQPVRNWWEYYFEPLRFQTDLVLTDIPPVAGTVTVTIEHGAAPAIGKLIVGEHIRAGVTQYGARAGIIDYSQYGTDAFGNEFFVKRHTARRASLTAWIEYNDIDYVQETLRELSGSPALWVGDNGVGLNSLVIYGFLKEYEISLDDWEKAIGSFEIRGIV